MNVFLMHPDRDFVPTPKLPFNEKALIEDLELNILFHAMAQGDAFLFDVAKKAMFSSLDSPQAIRYRQEILKDCLKNPTVVRELYSIPIEATDMKHRRWLGIFTHYPSGVLHSAVQLLEVLVSLLRKLKRIADEHATEFESQGFRRFFAMIQQELTEEYFAVVEAHLRTLRFKRGILISAELGKGNEGTNYILHKTDEGKWDWVKGIFSKKSPIYSYTLHPRDDAGARALGELRNKGLNLVANAAAQSAEHIENFFNTLRTELAFYIGSLNLFEQLSQLGEPIVFPDPVPMDERCHSFTGLYDPALALTMKKKVIGNDVNADGKDLVLITGANQGGKSVFLRSIGIAQLMMQCGLFVPAESFRANLCSGLFTHYKREEDATMTSGKLDEELGRMSEIVDHLTPNSLVLFNESFAATNEREGSEIARQIVNALLEKRIKVFFVTHLYELARGFHEKAMPNVIFLRAERKEKGRRTYKLIEAPPLPTSFGVDAYHKIFGTEHERVQS